MNKEKFFFILIFMISLPAMADEGSWNFEYKPFTGGYAIYGGELGELSSPSVADASISIKIEKTAAKEIFEKLGRDVKNQCPLEAGERMRMKRDLVCYKSQKNDYACYIGLDLKTGKSKAGIIC